MERVSLEFLTQCVSAFGIPGIIFVLWYFSEKSHAITLQVYRDDTLHQQKVFQDGLAEVRRMYENNVRLVEECKELASNLQNVVIMNTQAVTRLSSEIRANQYCPVVRSCGNPDGGER